MSTVNTIFPITATTFAISGSSVASTPVILPAPVGSVRILNEGPNNCYVSVNTTATNATVPSSTASAASFPIGAGSDVIFGVPADARSYISIICRAGQTSTLLVSVGEGT